MWTHRIRIRGLDRTPAPSTEAEGEHLAQLVRRALDAGSAAPVAVVVRPQRTDLVALAPLLQRRTAIASFLAALTRSEVDGHALPVAVGVAGRLLLRRGSGPPVPVAQAFLEWADCRWWQWQVLLDTDGVPLPDTVVHRRAADGDALPRGLGRWWSLGRRTGARLKLQRVEDEAPPLVH